MIRFTILDAIDLRASDGAALTPVLAQPKRVALVLDESHRIKTPGAKVTLLVQGRDVLIGWEHRHAGGARHDHVQDHAHG